MWTAENGTFRNADVKSGYEISVTIPFRPLIQMADELMFMLFCLLIRRKIAK